MYTMLAAAKLPEEFNADYYIATVTVLSVLVVAIGVLASFAESIPLEVERKWSPPFFVLVSFFYNFTPLLSALGIILGILALVFRFTSSIYQWVVFVPFVCVLVFVAIACHVYLRAVDGKRQRGEVPQGSKPPVNGSTG
jgi:hypothetical protein